MSFAFILLLDGDDSVPPGLVEVEGHPPLLVTAVPVGADGVAVEGHAPSLTIARIVVPADAQVDVEGHAPELLEVVPVGMQVVEVLGLAPSLATAVPVPQGSVEVSGHAPSLDVTGTSLQPPALRADLYSAAGAKLDAPPLDDVLSASYSLALNVIGEFTLEVPADSPSAAGAVEGRQAWIYRQDEGLVFKGFIEATEEDEADDGRRVLRVSGRSVSASAAWRTTLLGRKFDDASLSTVMAALTSGSGLAAGSLASPSTNMTARFDGKSLWSAIAFTAEFFGLLVREDHLHATPELDVGSFGSSSGLVLRNLEESSPELAGNPYMFQIQSLRVLGETRDVWNKIIPLGKQKDFSADDPWLTLANSTRTTPYTIQSAAGPDGNTYYWLEDSSSISAYGTRERVVQVSLIQEFADTATDRERAANALYDACAAELARSKDKQTSYEVEVVGLRHVSSGAYALQPGDKVRLQFNGVAEDEGGRRAYRTVDADLFVWGFERSFAPDGSDTWRLTVSTVARAPAGDLGDTIANIVSDVDGANVSPKPQFVINDVLRIGDGGSIVDADGSEWNQDHLRLDSAGNIGDAFILAVAGEDRLAISAEDDGAIITGIDIYPDAKANPTIIFRDGSMQLGFNGLGFNTFRAGVTIDEDGITLGTGASMPDYASGQGVVFIATAISVPTGTPSGGGVLFVDGSGNLKFRTSGGNTRTVAAV